MTITINPFVAGIIATLLVEFVGIIVASIILTTKKK